MVGELKREEVEAKLSINSVHSDEVGRVASISEELDTESWNHVGFVVVDSHPKNSGGAPGSTFKQSAQQRYHTCDTCLTQNPKVNFTNFTYFYLYFTKHWPVSISNNELSEIAINNPSKY